MRLSPVLAAIAVLGLAAPAIAGGCNDGHRGSASMAAAEPAVTQPAAETMTLIATLDCSELIGEQKATCIAAQAK